MELKSFDNLQQAKDLVRGLRDIMFYMETAEQDRLMPITVLAPSEAVLEKVYSLLEGMEEETYPGGGDSPPFFSGNFQPDSSQRKPL